MIHGPVVNVDLWEEVLDIILSSSCTFKKRIKVPSHVDIGGNERADKLAEKGRNMSPLYLAFDGLPCGSKPNHPASLRPPPPHPEDAPGGHNRPQHTCGNHSRRHTYA